MIDREAMQQALEALEWNLLVIEDYGDHEQLNRQHRAITALRERLAQPEPEQEPVAWMWRDGTVTSDPDRADGTWTPLYTTPPQRKPLTDEELYKVFPAIATYHEANKTLYRSIARAIEAAHGIKGEA